MLFNSWTFAIYLPIVLGIYYSLNQRWQNRFVLVASYVFYGWWDYRFLVLLFISTNLDYFCGWAIYKAQTPRQRRLFLIVTVAANLCFLGFFKYFNFFADSFTAVLSLFHMQASLPTLTIVLPVGLSFYTFQSMSYTIDIYRGKLKPCTNLLDYATYVAFFPQLVAGPINRAPHLLPQIMAKRVVDWNRISTGCALMLIGFFRKIAIADGIAPMVSEVFASPAQQGSLQLVVGLFLFSIQIYCDFAGYSDIARGVARLMGIDLMENFQHPYFSTNITEFWRRWHVSLSSWLRDYLYIPLGGNRKGTFNTYRNLFLTMLLGGLWHGANWTFIIWGAMHGLYLAVHKLILGKKRRPSIENRGLQLFRQPLALLSMGLTFSLVSFTWLFFRSPDFASAWTYLTGMLAFRGGWSAEGGRLLVAAVLLLLLVDIPQYLKKDHTVVLQWPWPVRASVYTVLVLCIFALRSDGETPFIYFQF